MISDRPMSWGGLPSATHDLHTLTDRHTRLPTGATGPLLPYGQGRSYGDSCQNDGGTLLLTHRLNHWIHFDPTSGHLECEAGTTLAEILQLIVPAGWFLPVTPGTRHVTVGGALANDVHGKNHHRMGTFAAHVNHFELLRSDGSRRLCSRTQNASWFRATIGGMGLTGLITRVSLRLRPITSRRIQAEHIRMSNLADFFALADESDASHEYTVAWVDCLASGSETGRGIFIRGNHDAEPGPLTPDPSIRLSVPFHAPAALLNHWTVKAFNTLYAKKVHGQRQEASEDLLPFFYPLDKVAHWNRLYGRRGFYQHQCVVPRQGDGGPIHEILDRIGRSGQASFLAVLKVFGDQPPEGLLSFPRPGVTLALDFPNRGQDTLQLMDDLDLIVQKAGGTLYPAKDARMSADLYRQSMPALDHFRSFIDPAFGSSFQRRVLESL